MASRDITEGRSTRAIAVDIGLNTGTIWQNTGNTYDCAIAGIPFLSAIRDDRPYERTTAPFRKQQFDSQRDPGEQSLSTWWLRSQSSFHAGEGIKFYDPLANPYSETLSTNSYRYKKSKGVEIFDDPGAITLLKKPTVTQATTNGYSIETVTVSGNDRILLRETAALKITDGTTSAMTTISAGVSTGIYASCNDGVNAYYVDGTNVIKTPLTGASTSIVRTHGATVTSAAMGYVKQRLVVGINNKLYEFATNGIGPYTVTNSQIANKIATLTTSVNHSLRVGDTITVASIATSAASYNGSYTITAVAPNTISYYHDNVDRAYETQSAGTITLTVNTPIYTHPNTSWVWTSITEGGSAIYAAGYSGANSAIYKFNLDANTGLMPTLTSGIIGAALPDGEVIHDIYVHLMSYIFIGTNKGVRVGTIDDATGNITYGPLMITTERPVRGFDAHNAYVYAASSLYDEAGLKNVPIIYRIDLATRIDTLRFAYQTDIYPEDIIEGEAVDVCWLGRSNQLAFICGGITNNVVAVATLGLYVQSATELYNSGYIETGLVRYNTLEPKNFKRVVGRGNFTYGSLSIQTRDSAGNLYDIVQYDAAVGNPEVTITQPNGAQDSLGLRFTLYQSATDSTKGPSFQGYQLKAVPATPRTRIITMPVMNFDTETDKYNTTIGYEGRAIERLGALENAESNGDVLTWQDFRTGEIAQVLIEEVKFTDVTPPDKRFTGYGGIITLTIRTV